MEILIEGAVHGHLIYKKLTKVKFILGDMDFFKVLKDVFKLKLRYDTNYF